MDLGKVCPHTVEMLARRSAERWQWAKVAKSHPHFVGIEMGDLRGITRILKGKGDFSGHQRGLLRKSVVLGLWSYERKAEANRHTMSQEEFEKARRCRACGDEVGTLRHALWRCPALDMHRWQEDLGDIGKEGAASTDEHPSFSHAIVPRLTYRACDTPKEHYDPIWTADSRKGYLEGTIYLDGSVYEGSEAYLARAGFAAVALDDFGCRSDVVFGPVPGPRQSIDVAELYAAVVALRFVCGEVTLVSDSSGFVKGWAAGRAWCTTPQRPNADLWRDFWAAAADVGLDHITVRKVKAHTSEAAVARGEISAKDRGGNAWADEFAKAGARRHRAPEHLRDHAAALHDRSRRLAGWIARGLGAASSCMALPPKRTAEEKKHAIAKERRLLVQADDTWRSAVRAKAMVESVHPTHRLWHLPGYLFCGSCGAHSSEKVVLLKGPCQGHVTSQRRVLLDRLLSGRHPKLCSHLGDAHRVDLEAVHAAVCTGTDWLRPGA